MGFILLLYALVCLKAGLGWVWYDYVIAGILVAYYVTNIYAARRLNKLASKQMELAMTQIANAEKQRDTDETTDSEADVFHSIAD